MRIELAPDIEPRLRNALHQAGSREIGGMLFAEQLAPGRFRIVDFSLDPISGSHANFLRFLAFHHEALTVFFGKTGSDFSRFNYLGEWHSHPSFSAQPSREDIDTMTDLVENGSSEITFALLLIVRLRFWMWIDYSMTTFAQGYAPHQARLAKRFI